MKLIKVLGVIFIALLLFVAITYFMGPDEVYIERSININAAPTTIYDELISFENFSERSAWYDKDPNAEYTISGPSKGVGAKMSWKSEKPDVGSGSMTIEEVEKDKMVLYRMNFGFPGEQFARFILTPEGNSTKVTWTYEEEPESFVKAMYVFMDMESMLGPDYEKGLKKLKDYIEKNEQSVPEEVAEETQLINSDSTNTEN